MEKLVYIGKGKTVAGVPARDLTPDEIEKFGKAFLLSSGLYQEVRTKIYKRESSKMIKEHFNE